MTKVEKKLKKFEQDGYQLHKVYYPDTLSSTLPDIFSTIDHIINSTDGVKIFSGHFSTTDPDKYFEIEIELEHLDDDTMHFVMPVDTPYQLVKFNEITTPYYFMKYDDPARKITIHPVWDMDLPIQRVAVEDNKIQLQPIDKSIHVYRVPIFDEFRYDYVTGSAPRVDNEDVWLNAKFIRIGCLYAGIPDGLVKRTFICKECGGLFTLKDEEIARFKQNGLNIPKRCFPCVKKRREKANKAKPSK